ncbi:MAG: prolyl oligopeptidase family serine peptidase [Bdellovibrionales bacterium]|nr:prolyl oligopeptidase family serine peptidase [Bdellovibrionales bacterium]
MNRWILASTMAVQGLTAYAQAPTIPTPAPALEIESWHTLHRYSWNDPYEWMRKLPDQPVSAQLQGVIDAENTYTEASFKPQAPLEAKILKEIQDRLATQTTLDNKNEVAPIRIGKRVYFYALDTQSIRMRRSTHSIEIARVPDSLIAGRTLVKFLPTSKLERMALLLSKVGDLAPGVQAPAPVSKPEVWIVEGMGRHPVVTDRFEIDDIDDLQWAWDASGKNLLYVDPENDTKNRQVFIRENKVSRVFFETEDEKTYVLLNMTRDEKYFRIEVTGFHLEYPVVYDRAFHRVFTGENKPGVFSQIESFNDDWVLKSNRGGRFYNVYRFSKTRGTEQALTDADLFLQGSEASDYAPDRNLDENTIGLDCFARFCAVERKTDGKPELVVVDSAGKKLDLLQFSEPFFYIQVGALDSYESTQFDLDYLSYLKPRSRYRYTLGEKGYKLVGESKIPAIRIENYRFEQKKFKVWDETEVPVTLVMHKDTKLTPNTPFFVQVYGTYATTFYIGYDVAFNIAHAASMLDRGVVYAFVHARGGGELGYHWYVDGNGANKYNTVKDFKSVLEGLVASKYTSPSKIAIGGFSAGGFAMGNAINDFPQLFKAALIQQGFLDMIGSQSDPEIPFVKLEWSIWGNPNDKNDFNRMWSMDPYQNLKRANYPAIFVRTSVDDNTVLVHEALKYVSKLRQKRMNTEVPTYLQILPAGMGAHDGRYVNYEIDAARNFTFLLNQIAPSKR